MLCPRELSQNQDFAGFSANMLRSGTLTDMEQRCQCGPTVLHKRKNVTKVLLMWLIRCVNPWAWGGGRERLPLQHATPFNNTNHMFMLWLWVIMRSTVWNVQEFESCSHEPPSQTLPSVGNLDFVRGWDEHNPISSHFNIAPIKFALEKWQNQTSTQRNRFSRCSWFSRAGYYPGKLSGSTISGTR